MKNLLHKLKPTRNELKLFILGLASVLIYAPTYYFYLGYIILSYYSFQLYKSANYKKSFTLSLYFFFGLYLSNIYWISFSFLVNKDYILLFPVVFIIIPLYFALFSSFFLSSITYIKNKYKLNLFEFYFLAILGFSLHEIFRGNIIPLVDIKGFPWNLLGYSFMGSIKHAQLASIFGIYGLNIIVIILYLSPLLIFTNKYKKINSFTVIIANIALLMLIANFGANHMKKNTVNIADISINMLHSNFDKYHHYQQDEIIKRLEKINLLIQNAQKADLLIVPEGSIANPTYNNYNNHLEFLINKNQEKFNNIILQAARIKKYKEEYKYFTSMYGVNNKGNIISTYYDKINLVPFGEYNPFIKLLKPLANQYSEFTAGKKNNSIINLDNKISIIPLICYDGIFSGKFSQDGDVILNVTNDIWFTKKIFGKNISVGPYQHHDIIRMRAIEEGKPLIRSANYGISTVINSFGEVVESKDFYDGNSIISFNPPKKLESTTIYNVYRDFFVKLFLAIYSLSILILLLIKKYLSAR
ncbi:MAG: apolipoprotein N-acyltransferase [Rickettsiales bacterium]|nr:apolipoprotein N-acyltransferase [Rickettsiales bacterium]